MASSDDEGETLPDSISDYHFESFDVKDEPLSFSKLPVKWNESESLSANVGPLILRGRVDNGLKEFYQQVKAWKYDILSISPEISVLSKDNHWIKLEKPRKSYENLIRSILISVHCVCFFKNKPDASGKSLWDYLSKVFSSYDTRPSENDLIDQIDFLREAVKRDETLSKSKFLATFLENPRKNSLDEDAGVATKPSFIVDDINGESQDDDTITYQGEDNESDSEDDHFDSVCAICDNGGDLTCCEGKCFRSFHASKNIEEAQESNCESLCLTAKELEILPNIQWKCENCKYNIHQCFVCGKLGSSDKSKNPEVFRCSSATCGHFYHPKCVAKLLQENDNEQQTLKETIAAGEPFICPVHKCAVCKQTENEKVKDLQFATCRRCPKSYHRKCLPRDIMFEDQIDDDDDDDDCDDEVRAWDGLLTKSRALIYCLEHEIDEELATPARTIIFRNILNRKTEQQQKKKPAVKVTGGDSVDPSKKKPVMMSQKTVEKTSAIKPGVSSKKRAADSSMQGSLKRKKVADSSKRKVKKSSLNDGQPSLGSRLFDLFTGTESNNLEKDETLTDDNNQNVADKYQQTEVLPPLDDESKQRIMALFREATSSVTLDEVRKNHQAKLPSTHSQSSRVEKNIILARVEGAVEAVNVASKKIKEGKCSVEEAMAFCEPAVIEQLMRWKDKLKVYLAPFLHGMRYTSFGRHFTKEDKLQEIVDKLHWYVEDGDMIVDFGCGANDFSCLMKKQLDETGKKNCSYKNYDIKPPKDDFNFEKRDWMTVSPKELPSGSRLIMGLNPPFGKNAALANLFINHALKFKPKLMILIVPPETKRLDSSRRSISYDLIWEDTEMLEGMSFYLPGSVDINDKQMEQWNKITPPLYLWSRPEWTNKHKSIAQQHGHMPQAQPPPPQSVEKRPKSAQIQQPLQSNENGTKSGVTVGKSEIEDDLAVGNKDSKTVFEEKSPKNKKRKKRSAGGSGSTSKQNSNKKHEGNKIEDKKHEENKNEDKKHEENKIEKRDDRDSNRQDVARKYEEVITQKHEIKPVPVEDIEVEKTRVSVEDKKLEKTRVSVEDKKPEKKWVSVEAQKHEKTQDSVENKKPEKKWVSVEAQKHEKTQDTVENKKPEKKWVSVEAQKHEKTRDFVEVKKHETSRAPSRKIEDQKYEKIKSPKHERARVSPREIEYQKHEKPRVSPRETEVPKHDKHRVSPREYEVRKHEKVSGPSREFEPWKFENKRASPHTREYNVHETLNSDFSFVDVDQPSGGRYNSAIIDESTFSLQNDLVQSYDDFPMRKYTSASDEPYMSSTTHRRLDSSNHVAPGSSVRPDHHQYSYYETTGSRVGSGYSMAREPGLTRHTPDATPYNRSSASATQKYAPKLDEMNRTRVNNLGRTEPPMGSRVVAGYRPPVNGSGYRMDSTGFAPGFYHPYQQNSSGGWLNE